MKRVFVGLFLPAILFSCYEVQRVELTDEVREELSLTKPMNITDAEIAAVANEIGDSLVADMDLTNDRTFSLEEHKIVVLSEESETALNDSVIKSKFEAYKYSFDNGQRDLPGLVKFKSRSEFAQYEVVKSVKDSTFKMVMIDVSIREVTKKIAKDRKEKK